MNIDKIDNDRKGVNIIKAPWKELDGSDTESLYLDVDRLCTVSELIELLEEAKRIWGDKEILLHEMNSNLIGGFDRLYLHHGFNQREQCGEDHYMDDTICIFG